MDWMLEIIQVSGHDLFSQIIITLIVGVFGIFKNTIYKVYCHLFKKYQKITEYVILGKVRDESFYECFIRIVNYGIKIFMIDVYLIFQYLICASVNFGLEIQKNGLGDRNRIFVAAIFTGEIILTVLVAQIRFKSNRIKGYLGAWILLIYVCTVLCFLARKEMMIQLMFVVIPFLGTALIMLLLDRTIWANQYRDIRIYLIRVMELMVMLVLGISNICSKTNNEQHTFDILFFIFLLLCLLEIKNDRDDKCVTEVVIHLYEGEEKVQEPIIYCVDNKVMYITQNGICKFVDMDDINYISYRLEKNWIKYKRNGKCVFCKLIDGEKIFFQTYRCEKKDWITFENYEERKREVCLYPVKKISQFGNS